MVEPPTQLVIGPPLVPRERIRLDVAGLITYARVRGSDLDMEALNTVDELAFDKNYSGGYGVAAGRRGYAVTASTPSLSVGYAFAIPVDGEPQGWYVDTVAVAADRQGEGIGSRLVRELASWLYEMGIQEVTGTALVGPDSDRRVAWMRRLGFVGDELSLVAPTATLATS